MAQQVKNLSAIQETEKMPVRFLGLEIPWRRKWQPTQVILPEKSHGQRSPVGYNSWGHKESDMTERLSVSTINCFILKAIQDSIV